MTYGTIHQWRDDIRQAVMREMSRDRRYAALMSGLPVSMGNCDQINESPKVELPHPGRGSEWKDWLAPVPAEA